jgi:hypothetical protein
LGIVVIAGGFLFPTLSQATEVSMILRQSPARGGVLRPEPGQHYYGANSQVFLAATANPGYEFICWLGDVGDPKANRTVVHLDQPKIIIALFERVEHNTLFKSEGSSGGIPITRGSLIGAADYSWATQSTAQAAGAGSAEIRYEASAPSTPAEPAEPGPPVPEPPIPEPATAVLLLAGGWFAFARHRINRHFARRRNHG